jgi:hypothetical protein
VLDDASDDPYANAEEVARAYLEARGIRIVSVRRVSGGPFVYIKVTEGRCVVEHISTQYSSDDTNDVFWGPGRYRQREPTYGWNTGVRVG